MKLVLKLSKKFFYERRERKGLVLKLKIIREENKNEVLLIEQNGNGRRIKRNDSRVKRLKCKGQL